MLQTTLPTNLFERLSDSYGNDFINYNDETNLILVYIGLITVILLVLIVIISLIYKCIKMFHDETISTKKKINRYRTRSLTNRQLIFSSVSISQEVIKPLNSPPLQTIQYEKQHSVPIIYV